MRAVTPSLGIDAGGLADAVAAEVSRGGRFAGLAATCRPDDSTVLHALIGFPGRLALLESVLAPGTGGYPALTPSVPSANWYEREIHDLFGIVPAGHPRLDGLVLPLAPGHGERPRPGSAVTPGAIEPAAGALPEHVAGEGIFTIPYGPVRSGVFESVEYLVETFGEDIPHVRPRVYHKHRGLERRFGELAPADGVLLAERVEGTAGVAHAIAFSQALESMAEVTPPQPAQLLRVAHAELERVANHLDSVVRHCEAAGQAVACARIALHKERLMRIRSLMSGSRFARGVVVPGGVSAPPALQPSQAIDALGALGGGVDSDLRQLMDTPSFVDRLRSTGVLPAGVAADHGALGPVGRASGLAVDVRAERPYGAYGLLGFAPAATAGEGDALARQRVRTEEIGASLRLARRALDELGRRPAGPWSAPVDAPDGLGVGWAEAPQGELIYLVEVGAGRLTRVKPRSASFHNLAVFPESFQGDILTDFAFIEASFGLSMAGVSG